MPNAQRSRRSILPCRRSLALALSACTTSSLAIDSSTLAAGSSDSARASVTVIADGVRGAGAICQIGTFHLGGPFVTNPVFAQATLPGGILHKDRLFVASSSNFGQPLGRADQAPGSVLSIDPAGGALSIPPDFAAAGGQASILGGRVKLYNANNAAFSNSIFNPGAATRDEVSVSNPTGISINNAFGRPWFASAPFGDAAFGTISVTDPGGMPFQGAPNPLAGGVFAGTVTNRNSSSQHGLVAPALATALITKSPDQSGRAVFLAALADGSVEQIHVQQGVDLIAPPGTLTPISGVGTEAAESTDANALNRIGMVFNWVPKPIVYITDPLADRIVALDLCDDGTLFTMPGALPPHPPHQARSACSIRYLKSPRLNLPIDMAPTMVEGAARNFASNTTLGGGSDLYVLNRGDNSIVRMTQAGDVLAVRTLDGDGAVPGMRVAGIATSSDGRTIYVTATVPGGGGLILSTPAFGQGEVTASLIDAAAASGASGLIDQGTFLFSHEHELDQGVGPLFNGRACVSCHNSPSAGGMGTGPGSLVARIARTRHGRQEEVRGGPIAREHSVEEIGGHCGLPTGIPREANVVSIRSTFTLRGSSLIDNILDFEIRAVQAAQPAAVRGKANVGRDGRIGHFGWKAQTATLVEFLAEATRDEMGVTNPLLPRDNVNGCGANRTSPEADGVELTSLFAFLNSIDPPTPTMACLNSPGATVFASLGCATCHTPAIRGPGSPTAAELLVHLYSDLLVHDMGPGLDDGLLQGQAGTSEFRTAPLWRVSDCARFLHDGRATTITGAIESHGGQAATAKSAFDALDPADRAALLSFLGCI